MKYGPRETDLREMHVECRDASRAVDGFGEVTVRVGRIGALDQIPRRTWSYNSSGTNFEITYAELLRQARTLDETNGARRT